LEHQSDVVIYNCNMFIIQTTECHNWDIMLLSVDVLCVILVHIVTPFVNYLSQLNLLNPYVTTFLSFIHTCGILWRWFPFPFQGERTLIDKLCHGQTWKRMHNIQPKCNAFMNACDVIRRVCKTFSIRQTLFEWRHHRHCCRRSQRDDPSHSRIWKMEQALLKTVTIIWIPTSTLTYETFGSQSSNLYSNVVHFYNASVN